MGGHMGGPMGGGMPQLLGSMGGGKGGEKGNPVPGRLFVTRVTPDMTKADLEQYFRVFGELKDCYVPPGGKGIAFVSFLNPEDAQQCLNKGGQHEIKPGQPVLVDQALD